MRRRRWKGVEVEGGKGFSHLLPPLSAYRTSTMDIYQTAPDPHPPFETQYILRSGNVPCLLTGNWLEGHRGKVQASDSYTHIALIDASYFLKDIYQGQGNPVLLLDIDFPDVVLIPAGQDISTPNLNRWVCAFQFQIVYPGLGRRKVCLLDRQEPKAGFAGIP
jgi:hypothetical protein